MAVGPRQAVMVKRLTAGVKQFQTAPLPEMGRASKATIPYTQTYRHQEEELTLPQ